MAKRMLGLVVLLALSLTVGCSYDGGISTTGKWMAGGAAVGGCLGGLAGSRTYWGLGNAGEGVLVGGAIGATAGGIIGNIIEEQQIKDLLAAKDKEIADLKAALAAKQSELDAANKRIAELEAELARLKKELAGRAMEIEITLGSDVVFEPGSARLSDKGKATLDGVAQKLKSQYAGKFIMVEGHTDIDPIKYSGWKSNWELGSARSLTVLHYLEEKGVDPAKLSAATFSKYQPVDPATTAAAKAKNRRAAIVVYKNWGTQASMKSAESAPAESKPANGQKKAAGKGGKKGGSKGGSKKKQ